MRILAGGREKVEFLIPKVLKYEQELSGCFSEAELQTFKTLLVKFFHSLTDETENNEERLTG